MQKPIKNPSIVPLKFIVSFSNRSHLMSNFLNKNPCIAPLVERFVATKFHQRAMLFMNMKLNVYLFAMHALNV